MFHFPLFARRLTGLPACQDDTAGQVDFSDLRDSFGDDIKTADEQRSRGFRAIFGILCAMVVFTVSGDQYYVGYDM